MSATVTLAGSRATFGGRIESLRYGVWRVETGAAVPVPPAAFAKRLVGVRVAVEWNRELDPAEFYGVGRSAKVVIENSEDRGHE